MAGAVATLFASFLMAKIGRRLGFALGALIGTVGGLVSVWSVVHADFWTFCAGTAAVGVFQAFAQYYRLAAADAVDASLKTKAISTVLTGGVIAALLGPALAAWSKDLFPAYLFAGAYLMVALLGGLLWAVGSGLLIAILILVAAATAAFFFFGGEADVDVKSPDVKVSSSPAG